jgi:hypothetical protein
MKKQGCLPKRIVTDKLASYSTARRQVMLSVEHRSTPGIEQPSRKLACAAAETAAGDAAVPFASRAAALREILSAVEISLSLPAPNTQKFPFNCLASKRWHTESGHGIGEACVMPPAKPPYPPRLLILVARASTASAPHTSRFLLFQLTRLQSPKFD